ncbi:MAG: glycosyltransferase [Alphaproteobacteria bacterium]|nr:MAG: glycosyltransferase [Alphaproteobacteria bacterium]
MLFSGRPGIAGDCTALCPLDLSGDGLGRDPNHAVASVRSGGSTVPRLSVVVPVYNEADNVVPLMREIVAALRDADLAPFEILFVDDGSTDATALRLIAATREVPEVRVIRHRVNAGQSAAVHTGVRVARGDIVVTLDGDGQNDPADIPRLVAHLNTSAAAPAPGLVAGVRVQRQDSAFKRLSSRVANRVRRWLLGDAARDSGCGIKAFRRDRFLSLPAFDHMHRFLPALFRRAGLHVVEVPVHHRPRRAGTSKYGLWNRLWVGIVDLIGVAWLMRRPVDVDFREVDPAAGDHTEMKT